MPFPEKPCTVRWAWGRGVFHKAYKPTSLRDDSEDDTDEPNQVLSFVGAAQAPTGYKILESCPRLETDEDMQKLISK